MLKILVIEDEKLLADSVAELLRSKGFEVEAAYDGEAGAMYAELGVYDLLILDVMMPKLDGFAVARQVRAKRLGVPILMLTARSALEDRIAGLDAGADYYLTKPFDTRELLACVNALLRRQGAQVDELTFGNTALDLASATLVCGEESVHLSAREFDVMRLLLLSDGDLLSGLVATAAASPQRLGVISEYELRYYRVDAPASQRLVFADISSERATLEGLRTTCLLIGGLSFFAFLWVSILLSKWAVRPVELAWKQQRRFVAAASHELKTPLTVIMTNAELLTAPELREEKREKSLSSILTMSRQMRGLIEQMLELARTDSPEAAALFRPVDLSRLVSQAVLPFEPLFFERGLSLDAQVEEGIGVTGEETQLRRVVEILLDNAQKYAKPGGSAAVVLRRRGRGRCVLSVSDEGDPIPPEERRQIFQRFYRADPARSRDGSFGLGLSIAEGIVKQHRGRIWAESRDGRNIFSVELPCP